MTIIPFEPHHIALMNVQPVQRDGVAEAGTDPSGDAWTCIADGVPIACGGLVELWRGRAAAWSVISADAGPHMLGIVRAVKAQILRSGFRRVELAADAAFAPGCRLAELLGFEFECLARGYLPNGRDARLYAKVTHG
jgi:hypothetical protein